MPSRSSKPLASSAQSGRPSDHQQAAPAPRAPAAHHEVVARQAWTTVQGPGARRGSRRVNPDPVRRQGDVELGADVDAKIADEVAGEIGRQRDVAAVRRLERWRGRRRPRNPARRPRPKRGWRCRPAGRARGHPPAGCRGGRSAGPTPARPAPGRLKRAGRRTFVRSPSTALPARKFIEPTKSVTKAVAGRR